MDVPALTAGVTRLAQEHQSRMVTAEWMFLRLQPP
jgi:hypothetical protein